MTTETKLRDCGMTAAAIQAEIAALQSRIKFLSVAKFACHDCAHFEAGAHCAIAQQQVPEDFQRQAGACPDWVWDGIPF